MSYELSSFHFSVCMIKVGHKHTVLSISIRARSKERKHLLLATSIITRHQGARERRLGAMRAPFCTFEVPGAGVSCSHRSCTLLDIASSKERPTLGHGPQTWICGGRSGSSAVRLIIRGARPVPPRRAPTATPEEHPQTHHRRTDKGKRGAQPC